MAKVDPETAALKEQLADALTHIDSLQTAAADDGHQPQEQCDMAAQAYFSCASSECSARKKFIRFQRSPSEPGASYLLRGTNRCSIIVLTMILPQEGGSPHG